MSTAESRLIRWLIEHGNSANAAQFLAQLDSARVVGRCGCGCASVDLAIDGRGSPSEGRMDILSEYKWSDEQGHLFGVYLFARGGLLAGLDLWSIDGQAIASSLPPVEQLMPLHRGSLH